MRTTLNLNDALIRAAKKRATDEDTTLTALIEAALRQYLQEIGRRAKPYRFQPLVKKSRLIPGVDLADRDSLYERMDGPA